jgi:hypothetical protein
MADIAPNQTIYVNNLPEKIKKEGALAQLAQQRREIAVSGFRPGECKK